MRLLNSAAILVAATAMSMSCSKDIVPVTGVTLNETEVTLEEGETFTLEETVLPEDAGNKTVSWATSDAAVVTVEKGVVTAVAPGEATITVTTEDGGKTSDCKIVVKPAVIAVESVSLDKTELTIAEGENATLNATVLPENATNRNVVWTSDNEEVATVSDGKITALKSGAATITVTTEDGGKTAECKVTVEKSVVHVESVSLDRSSLELVAGNSETLSATVLPENATDKAVVWSSSDESVATVEDGVVTAVGAGEAVITVTTQDGGKTATCQVTVEDAYVPVSNITLDNTSLVLNEGESATLAATVLPENATDKSLVWSSSDESVATVNDGEVVAVNMGTAVITVTTTDGGKTAECTVTVKDPDFVNVEVVSLNYTELDLKIGNTEYLVSYIYPYNATNQNVRWSSSNDAIATVDGGLVTAVSEGEAIITVTTEDGGKTAQCVVRVTAPVLDIVGNTSTNDYVAFGGESVQLSSEVPVTWSTSDESVATIDQNGKLQFLNDKDDVEVVVTATATEDGSSVTKTFRCHKTYFYYNDNPYAEDKALIEGGALTIPKNKYFDIYLGADGGQRIASGCYSATVDDNVVLRVANEGYYVEVKGYQSGMTTLRFTFNGGMELALSVTVE